MTYSLTAASLLGDVDRPRPAGEREREATRAAFPLLGEATDRVGLAASCPLRGLEAPR